MGDSGKFLAVNSVLSNREANLDQYRIMIGGPEQECTYYGPYFSSKDAESALKRKGWHKAGDDRWYTSLALKIHAVVENFPAKLNSPSKLPSGC